MSEVGLGVRNYDVVMCVRTFPIRVAGNSGPLPEGSEISWDDVQRESGYPYPVDEYTTTTKRLRRVARFDWNVVERAVLANDPSHLALHGADYLAYENNGATNHASLSENAQAFIGALEARTKVPVTFVGTGPQQGEIIDRRAELIASAPEQVVDATASATR